MKKKCRLNLIIYELRNINGNLMPHFFGIVFPNVMTFLLARVVGSQMPAGMQREAATSVMLTMSLVMPMSTMLLGYGCLYSTEIERGIPSRIHLFGIHPASEITAKIIAELIFLTITFLIFGIFQTAVMDVQRPAFFSLVCLIVSLYLLGIILLVISHSIAAMCKKFSLTFGITMALYFAFMILTGMMGIRTNQLPKPMQAVARTLPMTYISSDFIDFWQGGSYNFMPLLQSFLFFGSAAGILFLISSQWKRKSSAAGL